MERRGRPDQNGSDNLSQPLTKAGKRHLMMELSSMYLYGLIDRYGYEYKTENTHINMAKNSHHYLGSINRINHEGLHKCFCKLSPKKFNSKFNTMLDTNIKDVPNFIQAFPSNMRKPHLKSTQEMLSLVLKSKSSEFMFGQHYLQAIDFIEFF